MIDITPTIAKILEKIAPVELSGSESTHRLPFLTVSATNSQEVSIDHLDFYTRFDVQIDCYADTPKQCVGLATDVDIAMKKNGFTRSNGQLIGMQRYMLRFIAYIGENNHVYKEV